MEWVACSHLDAEHLSGMKREGPGGSSADKVGEKEYVPAHEKRSEAVVHRQGDHLTAGGVGNEKRPRKVIECKAVPRSVNTQPIFALRSSTEVHSVSTHIKSGRIVTKGGSRGLPWRGLGCPQIITI